ncbi:hypothetical protein [Sphingomonas yabuuchiae]|uniref:hypothetical protein n=1 Tax=Sphingomonas yabuuchiae TaxID=172044 RepID=UPI001428CAF9|nr:hypothetical protein [Sphingomonas yabuuchiae]
MTDIAVCSLQGPALLNHIPLTFSPEKYALIREAIISCLFGAPAGITMFSPLLEPPPQA